MKFCLWYRESGQYLKPLMNWLFTLSADVTATRVEIIYRSIQILSVIEFNKVQGSTTEGHWLINYKTKHKSNSYIHFKIPVHL